MVLERMASQEPTPLTRVSGEVGETLLGVLVPKLNRIEAKEIESWFGLLQEVGEINE